MRILVVRPEPGNAATAARLRAMGHTPVAMPLFDTDALAWAPPAELPDAVIFTSAAGVRHAGPQADALKTLPALCVGEATAAAA
uniref:uroporphyrinogen-III synthase n=1 Tax=Sandarakinorhabdus rubra TaxID=2672568 RepID=UPI00196A177B